jgi:hypothetical protein
MSSLNASAIKGKYTYWSRNSSGVMHILATWVSWYSMIMSLVSDTRVPPFIVYRSSNQPDVAGMM